MKRYEGLCDIHAHILPGADHGSHSTRMSADQLQLLYGAGVERVVATPHFYPQRHTVEAFLERRGAAQKALTAVLDDEKPRVMVGAEVLVTAGIDRMEGLSKLCIQGTDTILLEMPMTLEWSEELYETVYRISRLGLRVLLAHVNRYKLENIERLCKESGAVCQLNGEVSAGLFGKKKACRLAELLPVSGLGSDIHEKGKAQVSGLIKLADALGAKTEIILKKSSALLEGAKEI